MRKPSFRGLPRRGHRDDHQRPLPLQWRLFWFTVGFVVTVLIKLALTVAN